MCNAKILILTQLILLSVFLSNIYVDTSENGFVTEEVEDSKKDKYFENLNLKLVYEEERMKPIKCFDVRQDGYVILGFEHGRTKKACIYDADINFLYGYEFDSSGSFGLGWENNNAALYLVRSDLAIILDDKGECVDIRAIEDSIENNDYWNNVVRAKSKIVGDKTYVLKDDMGILNVLAVGHSQLVIRGVDGSETILYNVNDYHLVSIILILIFGFIGLVCFVLWFLYLMKPYITQNNSNNKM